MKNKKLIILIILLIIQIVTPVYAVVSKNLYLENAESYKIKVEYYDPYDVLRGKYLNVFSNIHFQNQDDEFSMYKVIEKDENGYLVVVDGSYRVPTGDNYYKELEIDRYYMPDELAEKADKYIMSHPNEDYYVEVLIKNGKYKVIELYVNDEGIEDIVSE